MRAIGGGSSSNSSSNSSSSANLGALQPYHDMAKLRATNSVRSMVNMDDAEVNQRAGHVTVENGGRVLVWGGYIVSRRQAHDRYQRYWRSHWLMSYQADTGKWFPMYTHPEDAPRPASAAAGEIVNDTLYLFCGFCVDLVVEHGPNGGTNPIVYQDNYPGVSPRLEPEERHKACLARNGIESLLVTDYAGISCRNRNEVHALDLQTRRWKKLEPQGTPPFKCDKLSAWVYDRKIYLFGGYGNCPDPDHRLATPPTTSWIMDRYTEEYEPRGWNNQLVGFDPETCSWSWPKVKGSGGLDSMPCPRAAHATAVNPEGGYVLMMGGRHGNQRLNDLYILDMATFEWSLLQPATDDDMAREFRCPQGRSWHSLTYLSDHRFLLYGGYSDSEQPLGDCWRFTLNPKEHRFSSWERLSHLEDPAFGLRIWHTGVRIPDGDGAMIVGGFASPKPISSPDIHHGNSVLRLQVSPKSLRSLALDASCALLESQRPLSKLEGQIPSYIIHAVEKRLPKFAYDRALAFMKKNPGPEDELIRWISSVNRH